MTEVYIEILFSLFFTKNQAPSSRSDEFTKSPYWQLDQINQKVPMMFVAGDAFPLSNYYIKPFLKKNLTEAMRIFDYRLSQYIRVSKNLFGIWVSEFRLFTTSAQLSPEKAKITKMTIRTASYMLRIESE